MIHITTFTNRYNYKNNNYHDNNLHLQQHNTTCCFRRRDPNNATNYTGHQHLDDFALINMNGRVYDPTLGRFLSPDPYVQSPGFTQSYNRYAYCWNNPLSYTDPSGEFIFTALALIIPGGQAFLPMAIGADIGMWQGGTLANDGETNPLQWDYSSGKTWWYMAGGAAIGAASGYSGGAVAADGGFMANTFGTMSASYMNSVGMNIMSGGLTDISIGVGFGSYNFSSGEFNHLLCNDISTLERIGYGLGTFSFLNDVMVGGNYTEGKLTLNTQKTLDLTSHSGLEGVYNVTNEAGEIVEELPIKVSVGPRGRLWSLKKQTYADLDWHLYGDKSFKLKINRVKLDVLANQTKSWSEIIPEMLSDGISMDGKLFYPIGKACSGYAAIALWRAGVPTSIGFLHPYLLHLELAGQKYNYLLYQLGQKR